MAVKSIIDVDVRTGAFAAFQRQYEKYEKALKSAPAAWALVNKNIDGSRASFDKLVGQMAAANVQAQLRAKAQERADQLTRTSAERWQSMARSTRDFASNIAGATASLLKWASVTGLISGLAGAGGLFGIDRLAIGAAQSRRAAFGTGSSIGGQEAFQANFGRLVDPEAFLSSVAGAKFDVSKRVGLYGAGMSEGEIGGDTSQTAVTLLRKLKQIADTTNPALFAQVLQARRLDQFAGPQDLERLRATSPAEFERLSRQYGQRKGQFDLPGDVAERWQDFVTQINNAGKSIEATFVKGLVGLQPGLTKLSEAVEKFFGTLLEKGGPVERWIGKAGEGLETFAKYVADPAFEKDVRSFIEGVGQMADAVGKFVNWLGPKVKTAATVASGAGTIAEIGSDLVHGNIDLWGNGGKGIGWGTAGQRPVNNPGNLRPPGQSSGFQQFTSPEAGVAAMARQLRLYENRDHLDTIEKIVSKYAPPGENDTRGYVRDVSKRSGYEPGQHLNLNNPEMLSRLIAAMIAQEQRRGSYDKYKDAKVVVEIIKPAGSGPEIAVNGLKD